MQTADKHNDVDDCRNWIRSMTEIDKEVLFERRKNVFDASTFTPEYRVLKAKLMMLGVQLFHASIAGDDQKWSQLVHDAASIMHKCNLDPMTLFLEFSENPSSLNWNRLYAAMAVTQTFSHGGDQ